LRDIDRQFNKRTLAAYLAGRSGAECPNIICPDRGDLRILDFYAVCGRNRADPDLITLITLPTAVPGPVRIVAAKPAADAPAVTSNSAVTHAVWQPVYRLDCVIAAQQACVRMG